MLRRGKIKRKKSYKNVLTHRTRCVKIRVSKEGK
nr:MAG TPA: hypothetical protein [Caudoviricetes sp.]